MSKQSQQTNKNLDSVTDYVEDKEIQTAGALKQLKEDNDLVRNVDFLQLEIEFCKILKQKNEETGEENIQLSGLKQQISGRHIIIVEDIIDSGYTMDKLLQCIKLQNPKSVKTCSFILKQNQLKVQNLQMDYIGIEIEPKFIVGYGVDVQGWGRNFQDILFCE
ncbi:hypoxanthine phosphoribosyltransferase, putative [Ichthyophthirius multifiliis]|uniref:Hypoxanthine phosphoribosyltransferase, putative n=1 Tax=Ichthyophthirius multifiliis TaxID=5932 RepID=G0R2E4_ICHMU|nr:hypoxanthine phosphoribosyltransferase, putative [Ichthyophthirius multifiliis]EGR28363.1 hypoxanthine phosphoribosyltransferase, putative [Ichthyophthirius multifiliis]|eukprot:XP_004027708.1 hypoxanthine phosphoribosyltransferase, putative [Ichthyophthirius multifiliis]